MTQTEFDTRFTNIEELPNGGFAEVFKALDTKYIINGKPRLVVLKRYTQLKQDEKKYTLKREIGIAIGLQHGNICKYLELVEVESLHDLTHQKMLKEVVVMEYLDGGQINEFIKLQTNVTDKLLIDVLRGLSYLHRNSIIHRDIKPANVMVCYVKKSKYDAEVKDRLNSQDVADQKLKLAIDEYIEPVARITDFGISKITEAEASISSRLFGSKPYIAPEQIEPLSFGIKGEINHAVDIWSFGVMAYEIITGKHLFESIETNTDEIVRKRILGEHFEEKLLALPEKYKKLLQKCLVRKAVDRCSDCNELIKMLEKKEESTQGSGAYEGETVSVNGGKKETVNANEAEFKPLLIDDAYEYLKKNQLKLAKKHIKKARLFFPENRDAIELENEIEIALANNKSKFPLEFKMLLAGLIIVIWFVVYQFIKNSPGGSSYESFSDTTWRKPEDRVVDKDSPRIFDTSDKFNQIDTGISKVSETVLDLPKKSTLNRQMNAQKLVKEGNAYFAMGVEYYSLAFNKYKEANKLVDGIADIGYENFMRKAEEIKNTADIEDINNLKRIAREIKNTRP